MRFFVLWLLKSIFRKSLLDPNKYYEVDESRVLGKGGFGAVYWGFDKETQAPVAVKKMTINKRNKMEYLLIETELHAKSSHHPNIVTFLDAFLVKELNEFWVILYFVENAAKKTNLFYFRKQVVSEFIDGCTLESMLSLVGWKEPEMAHVAKAVTNG